MANKTSKEFIPQEKRMKMDVHKVLIKTGFSEVEERYYVEIKSLNNPLFRGKQYIEDSDDVDIIFRNLKNKDDIYNYIKGIYTNPSSMSLSKVFADEKEVRDIAKAKEMAAAMSDAEGGEGETGVPPIADNTPEENEENDENTDERQDIPGLFVNPKRFNTVFSEIINKIKYK